jgi:hypothetical protein
MYILPSKFSLYIGYYSAKFGNTKDDKTTPQALGEKVTVKYYM